MSADAHEPNGAGAPVRSESLAAVLDALLRVGPDRWVSREELGERAELARATVSRTLGYLKDLNRHLLELREEPVLLFDEKVGQTRRAEYVRLNPLCSLFLAADASHNRLTVAVGDPWGRVQSKDDWRSVPWDVDADPQASLDKIASMMSELMEGRDIESLLGIGLAVAAPVSPATGIVRSLKGVVEPGRVSWVGLNPALELERRLPDWHGHVEVARNDADVAAENEFRWAEKRWAGAGRLRDMIYLKWSSGIGSAAIIGGHLHVGEISYAGEMHTPVLGLPAREVPAEECPRCGRRNCLENIASYDAMKRRLNLTDKSRAEFEWDPRGKQEIERVAVLIGRTLGPTVNMLAPQSIVIGGPSPSLHSTIATRIREGLTDTAVAPLAAEIEIRIAEPRWIGAGDKVGRLAVVSGAITSVSFRRGVSGLRHRLSSAEARSAASKIEEAS